MTSQKLTTASLLRLEEQLRQERETFDQRKEQESRWFSLRLKMGYIAAIMLPTLAFACMGILFGHVYFSPTVVTYAGAALFLDILGLLIAVWKIVLNAGSVTKLEPTVTDSALSIEALITDQE